MNGACYACVLHVAGEDQSINKRVCEDGPVLNWYSFGVGGEHVENRLAVSLPGLELKNPIIPASLF